MRAVIAPDKFKGSLSAQEAAEAIARGFRSAIAECETTLVPMADGGEGTVDAFLAGGAQRRSARVRGPLGKSVTAVYARDGELAIVEMAAASGLALLAKDEYDPLHATTFGTGELLLAAAGDGARRCLVGIGGSATVDCGTGMLRALGVRFLDDAGNELGDALDAYEHLARIDAGALDPRVAAMEIVVASDVRNPLVGERGAPVVFAPQKGATPEQIALLERILTRIADVTAQTLGRDERNLAGAGAAGGLGLALAAYLHARIEDGALVIAKERGLDRALAGAQLCATGEGSIDMQTLEGKTVDGVAQLARAASVRVVAFGGRVDSQAAKALAGRGVEAVEVATGIPAERAMREAATLLERRAAAWATSYTRSKA